MRTLTLPYKYYAEYCAFVESNPVIPTGKTYLEVFMRNKGLFPVEEQLNLERFFP